MITLQTDKELLIRIQKNQVSVRLKETCLIRLTNQVQDEEISIEVEAAVQSLTNIYILSVTSPIANIGTKVLLEIYDDEKSTFSEEAFLTQSV